MLITAFSTVLVIMLARGHSRRYPRSPDRDETLWLPWCVGDQTGNVTKIVRGHKRKVLQFVGRICRLGAFSEASYITKRNALMTVSRYYSLPI